MNNIKAKNTIKQWQKIGLHVDLDQGLIIRDGKTQNLEPMVLELLKLLINQPNQVVSKTYILNKIWGQKYVNDEALTKLVSKLRKALDDSPQSPKFIKTVPKKGYVLLVEERIVNHKPRAFVHLKVLIVMGVFISLLTTHFFINSDSLDQNAFNEVDQLYERAESHYYQYSRIENESAMKLYEEIIANNPNHALSQSGLANALVQKTLRWPNAINEPDVNHTNLIEAIDSGRLSTVQARLQLSRAEGLAKRAATLAPNDAKAQRTLGLVYATQQKFELAKAQYKKAIELDSNEWGAMINLSEIQQKEGNESLALTTMEAAFAAMTRVYKSQEVRIRPWYNKLAVTIAEKHLSLGNLSDAEIWFRQVRQSEPYNEDATLGLIHLLKRQGDFDNAQSICLEFQQKVKPDLSCKI